MQHVQSESTTLLRILCSRDKDKDSILKAKDKDWTFKEKDITER